MALDDDEITPKSWAAWRALPETKHLLASLEKKHAKLGEEREAASGVDEERGLTAMRSGLLVAMNTVRDDLAETKRETPPMLTPDEWATWKQLPGSVRFLFIIREEMIRAKQRIADMRARAADLVGEHDVSGIVHYQNYLAQENGIVRAYASLANAIEQCDKPKEQPK